MFSITSISDPAGARAAVRLALLRAAARRADGALPDGHRIVAGLFYC